jgi:hypothetical protein
MDEETKFHWSEGMKYAHESIKGVFLINGGGAISILTFIGNKSAGGTVPSEPLVHAMLCFAFGAMAAPLAFLFAYLTQLQYGNRALGYSMRPRSLHYAAYFFVISGLILFVAGMICAATGFFAAVPVISPQK